MEKQTVSKAFIQGLHLVSRTITENYKPTHHSRKFFILYNIEVFYSNIDILTRWK